MNYAETMFPLPNGWECSDSGDLFCEIFPTAKDIPDHGFKLRVNVPCLKLFPSVLRVIASICFREKIPLKFASSSTSVKQLYAKNIGIDIAGKAITVYPGPDDSRLIDLVKKITQSLKALSLPPSAAPWSDKKITIGEIGESCLSYRYGSYLPQATIRIAGVDFTDRRDLFVLPPGISDPFGNTTSPREPEEVPETVRLNEDYEISHVLTRNFGGSVYAGRSLRTNDDLIIKQARPDAIIACEGEVLSTDLLTNEYSVLTAIKDSIKDSEIAPVPVELIELNRHLFLVFPRIGGQTLFNWRLDHGSEPDRCANVARQIATKLCFLHETDTTHGDLSLSNSIISDDDSVRFIDFEMARHQNTTTEDFAIDLKQFSQVLRALLPNSKDNSDTIRLAEEGAPIQHILDRLNP